MPILLPSMKLSYPTPPQWHWRSRPRETAMLAILGCAAVLAIAGVSDAMPTLGNTPKASLAAGAAPMPTSPSATELRDVAPQDAVAMNALIPLAKFPSTAAAPFTLGKATTAAQAQALECLTNAIYYEAGRESDAGQRAVAQVILNRVRHPAYPASVCGVVFEGSTRATGCQFTFTCDGSMARTPMASEWSRARKVAWSALNGSVYAAAGLATHYHANYVVPYWASSLVKTHIEGPHIFYRWAGGWGRPSAFHQRYAAREGDVHALRLAALSVDHVLPKVLVPGTVGAAIEALDEIKGVKVAEAGDRLSIQFNLKAREAVEKAVVTPYVERVAASDNLRRALDGSRPTGVEAKPFGPPAEAMAKPAAPAN
ncbi:MAG: cell wall hydrolase [Sphingomonas bacterium]|nr:cell wall hydrolase [Sphingomonas bacterium]